MHSQMSKFCNNVIDDFITLVEKQYKGKNAISIDEIEKMKKSLKSKMKNTESFNKNIMNKFFDQAMTFALKPQTIQMKNNNDMTSLKFQENLPVQSGSLSLKKSNSQEQEDDLNQFKKHKNLKHLQKQVHKETFQSIKFNDDDLLEFNEEDLDEKLNINELISIKQKTGLHILGMYNTKQKKFNSKKQQTRFTVYNALLKLEGHDQEVLFPVAELVSKRTSKSKLSI